MSQAEMKQLTRLLIILTLILVTGILSWFVWTNGSVAGSINPDSTEAQNIVIVFLESSADGRIRYGYGIELPSASAQVPADAAELLAMVEYDTQTIERIDQYVALNQNHLERLLKTVSCEQIALGILAFNEKFQ